MDNFPPYDLREPQQQQQQAQWQAPQSHQWQPEWQAPPRPVPPQYIPYPGQVPVMAFEPQKSWIATVLLCQFLGTLGMHRFYTGRVGSNVYMYPPQVKD